MREKDHYPPPHTLRNLDSQWNALPSTESARERLVHNPAQLTDRPLDNKMIEKGFDGRGVINVSNKGKPDRAYQLFLKSLGDDENHSQLKHALAASESPAAQRFLADLFSSRKRHVAIETLAKRHGIGIPQLRDIWRHARLDQGLIALLNAYPLVMRDTARDARSTRESCRICSGTGKLTDEHLPPVLTPKPSLIPGVQDDDTELELKPALVRCHSCRGRGWTRKPGDKDARAVMGEVLGVTSRNRGLNIAPTTNISLNLESVISDIERMQPAASRGIYDAVPEPPDKD